MQSPELAVSELERLKKNGLKGVQIGSNIEDFKNRFSLMQNN